MLELIAKTEISNETPVELFRTNFGYAVRYGLDVQSNLTAELAKQKYQDAIRHALTCAGVYETYAQDLRD